MSIGCIFALQAADWSRVKLYALLNFEGMMVEYLLPMTYQKGLLGLRNLMQCYVLKYYSRRYVR